MTREIGSSQKLIVFALWCFCCCRLVDIGSGSDDDSSNNNNTLIIFECKYCMLIIDK